MKFTKQKAEVYFPVEKNNDVAKTTDLCIAAHQDDIEIMAYGPISYCYGQENRHFTGVVVSDGAGSPRTGLYENYTNEQMMETRVQEQKNAALIGGYLAQYFLSFKSSEIKDAAFQGTVDDIKNIIISCRPETVYTHNLADKHDTHVAVALRTIEAIRQLPAEQRPKKLYALEVWRGLDWLCDKDKAVFDSSQRPNLSAALLGVFDSQIAGGKRYDLASAGRRLANATYFESHSVDAFESITFGLDMTKLITDNALTPSEFIISYIKAFETEVNDRIGRFGK